MAPCSIAVAGKGGVGKTSIAAAIVAYLMRAHPSSRILAIDADPAVGLETSLGVSVHLTVDDIRKEIASAGEGDREKRRAIELLGESRYRLLDAIAEEEGFAFLASRRPPGATAASILTSARSSAPGPTGSTMWSSTARRAWNRSTAG